MKTSPMLAIALGLLLCGNLAAQGRSATPEWQSLKVDQTVEPFFPQTLLAQGVTQGSAEVALCVDTQGQLIEWLVIRYTDKELADAVITAVKQWKFEPGRLNGSPVSTTIELVFNFEARGVVISSSTLGEAAAARISRLRSGAFTYRPRGANELDRAPVATVTVAPQYPKSLAEKGVKGTVVVEYYIDETGTVRMPCVSSEDDPVLGGLTVAAVSQWKFEPATSHGRTVLVKAQQTFHFKGDGS